MKTLRLVLVLILSIYVTSCSSVTIDDYFFKTADLTSYKTFDWMSRPHAMLIAKEGRGQVEKLLKESVNKQLTARGFSQKADSPDLLISYLVGAELTNIDDSSGKVGEQNNPAAQPYSGGAILLDFVDGKTRELLWRVAAFGLEDRNTTPEKNKEIVEKTVERMFKNFPSASIP
jgi:hypothetical protein